MRFSHLKHLVCKLAQFYQKSASDLQSGSGTGAREEGEVEGWGVGEEGMKIESIYNYLIVKIMFAIDNLPIKKYIYQYLIYKSKLN